MAHEFYAIDLPGKMLYKKPFNISIRRITPIEQRYIISLSQKEQVSEKEYVDFLKKLIQFDNPEMTFEDLFYYDFQYILYRIRFTTYPKYPIKLKFVCRGKIFDENDKEIPCETEIKQDLDMGKLIINTPDDLPNLRTTIDLENLGTTPIRQKIMGDDSVISSFAEKNSIDINDIQMRLLLLDLCLISNDKSLEEMWKLAEEGIITTSDILEIEKWFGETNWGVKEEMIIKCPKCGKEESRGYYLTLDDFFSAF